jgi:hypothetical protein
MAAKRAWGEGGRYLKYEFMKIKGTSVLETQKIHKMGSDRPLSCSRL